MNRKSYCLSLPYILLSLLFLVPTVAFGQRFVSKTIRLPGFPEKSYALYLPSHPRTAEVVISFHPYNAAAWNADSWRDRLSKWAEQEGVFLICPDGGTNGLVDDPIDLHFTAALWDTLRKTYQLPKSVWVQGYSWGARAALKYATLHPGEIKGLALLSFAAEGAEARLRLERLKGAPVFFAQGERDNNNGYVLALRRQLQLTDCYTGYTVLPQSGHEFSDSALDLALNSSWRWLKQQPGNHSDQLRIIPVSGGPRILDFSIKPHPTQTGKAVMTAHGDLAGAIRKITIYNSGGETVQRFSGYQHAIEFHALAPGVYVVSCEVESLGWLVRKVLIL